MEYVVSHYEDKYETGEDPDGSQSGLALSKMSKSEMSTSVWGISNLLDSTQKLVHKRG